MDLVTPWHVGSSWTRDRTHVPCTGRRILNHWTNREVQHFHFCHCENWVESTEAHLWDVVAYGPSLCLACITCQLCALGHCGNLWGLKGSQWSTPSGIVVGIKVKVSAQCLGSAWSVIGITFCNSLPNHTMLTFLHFIKLSSLTLFLISSQHFILWLYQPLSPIVWNMACSFSFYNKQLLFFFFAYPYF